MNLIIELEASENMDSLRISEIFHEMAVFSELLEESPFKSRAYEKAARIIENLGDEILEIAQRGELTKVDGIGEKIASKIKEIIETGELESRNKMLLSIPDGVLEMLKIPSLGPKRVRGLWKDYGISSVASLKLVCDRHGLAKIPGYGAKMERNILAGIAMLRKNAGKWLLSEAWEFASDIAKAIGSWDEVESVKVAGSLRRRKELVKDVDLVVATQNPKAVMKKFVSLPFVERVIQHGDTKSEVILDSGIQCDLRAVSPSEYPFALHHFTGSKEHNLKMRSIAKDSGMKLNEYGIFKGSSKKALPCKDEAEIFKTLSLDYIPPELREDMGEIEAASHGALPKLIEEDDLKGVLHVHSNYSDGVNSISELKYESERLGYEYLLICDHSKSLAIANGMDEKDVVRQHQEIDRLNMGKGGCRVLKGIEADILGDGSVDFDGDMLSAFDIVIASVHSKFKMDKTEMTDRIIRAIENHDVDIIGHPSGRLLLSREPYQIDTRKIIDAASANGKAIEINSHPQRLDLDWRWIMYARKKKVKLAIGVDAHDTFGLSLAKYGIWIARKGWLEKDDVINSMAIKDFLKRYSIK
ncbi:MAG TPA: DNA polymerase/3'-5' exonuclease PolX [bacterium]|nr:DNA polymerase/3'-5' exonuclease PolX [bacterium]